MSITEFIKRCAENNYSYRLTYYSSTSSYRIEMGVDDKMCAESGKNLDMILLLCWSRFTQGILP